MATLPSALVVPIDLSALCVGKTDVNGSSTHPYGTKDFARLAPDFSLLPYADQGIANNPGPYTSDQVLTTAFQPSSQPLDVGIHLHWALPQSLAHGTQDATGKITFPPAPNRWLVVRIASNTAVATAPVTELTGWVVESDRLWDKRNDTVLLPVQNAVSLDIPIKPNPIAASNKSFKTIGRIFPYVGWAEDTTAERGQLTALGFGEAHYAASSQYCTNVFGMWDPLGDIDQTRFPPATTRMSYLLIGWHADIVDDPLSRVTYPSQADNKQKLAAIAAQLDWSFALAAGASMPTRTIYSALTTAIPWDPDRHFIDPHAASSDLEIAVGNTSAEAVSALLAAQPDLKSLPKIEFVLNALQTGILSRLTLPGGLADMDEVLHQADFTSTNVGQIWVIVPVKAKDGEVGASDRMLAAARNLKRSLPAGAGDALNALNETQSLLDRTTQEVESLRARIFADWYRYMSIEYPPAQAPPSPISPNDARTFIESEIAELNVMLGSITTIRNDVKTQGDALKQLIGPDYMLDMTNGPRYWSPSNPVVLFSGSDVQSAYRNRMPAARDPSGNLVCRTGADLVSAMIAGSSAFTIHAANLPTLGQADPDGLGDVVAALVGEGFFVDVWQAPVLAAAVAALGGSGNPAADYAGLVSAITSAQQGEAGGKQPSITFVGTPGAAGSVKPWSLPWVPIILQWQSSFYANGLPPYDSGFILKNYQLDEADIDLQFKGTIPVDPKYVRTYQGTIVLSHNSEIDLAQQIKTYLANFPDDDVDGELKTVLDNLDLSAQAQALSGFNQAFLMLDRVLQMEVSDPLAILQGLFFSNFTNRDVKDAVGVQNVDSPRGNNSFCPLRNGAFAIDRLRVVDAFGQVLDIERPKVIRAESLIAPGDSSGLINLPVRLSQAAALRFNWLAADNDRVETNSDPATTPVIGWVLYNHLDHALAIYDTAGTAIGSFNLLGPFWQGAPGNTANYGQPIEKAFASANPHLRDFALGLAGSPTPVDYLGEILAAIDNAAGFISPRTYKQDGGLSVLIGRPIALVRAAVKLDLLGLPAMDQSMSAFGAAIASDNVLERQDGQLPQLQVPVRIGELSDIDDGMVGYFIEDGEPSTYQTFYSPAARSSDSHGVKKPSFGQVVVTADRSVPPVLLTLLVDPHASVHATTGLLPMKELTIPPAVIADDLANMAVTFLTTPFVSGGPPEIPVPAESGFVWNWVTQPSGAGWTIEPVQSASVAISTLPRRAVEGWLSLSQAKKSTNR
ncbi:hypothetical protein ACVIHI_009068 [Bradyrhizobium sp. USDA 4524]|uniref:hypothetical protein n=1 Tax=unclassified Bradyrhizobium TaxID=2631580 RepID=UPI0020A1B408|nr:MULTISPECIES: hypothetical protein [unclassified Bradyrhizobium]MCP1846152.1 hypothetical protein [Bradyrhizobium sp. USDA 4538]MCP1907213.1 hypothetical protein [Bradyrhizobium sp. USDA 4537]MCP1985689.1 hypothetical protein [Bradyrhizobium sp. USDA 4539]